MSGNPYINISYKFIICYDYVIYFTFILLLLDKNIEHQLKNNITIISYEEYRRN